MIIVKHISNRNHTNTGTGRLSCENPNLQQMPHKEVIDITGGVLTTKTINDPLVFNFRDIIMSSSESNTILIADYSQIEMRILAHYSNDKNLIDIFNRDGDVYKVIACKVFGISDVNSVTDDQRATCKTILLAMIYGQGSAELQKKSNLNVGEATKLKNDIFKVIVILCVIFIN